MYFTDPYCVDNLVIRIELVNWMRKVASIVQRTDATHVLAAVRMLHHLECLVETLHFALNSLAPVVTLHKLSA